MKVFVKRWVYFGYYLRQMDWPLLAKFMDYVQVEKGWSKARQWRNIIRDSLKFNISPLEYYQFRFFDSNETDKAGWAGTGTMYEFQSEVNPTKTRVLLRDKRRFYKAYKKFFRHEVFALSELRTNSELIETLLEKNDKLVFKEAAGNCGTGVSIKLTGGMNAEELLEYMTDEGFDLVEGFVYQHPALNRLSPSAVNTVRIFTQIKKSGEYEILGCRIRISIDSPVDNLAAGNIAAPVDMQTGVVNGPGVFADITREPAMIHPITGQPIVGFQIPFWHETLDMVREASLLHPENRSVGWDVVITEEGPGLIEGNHDWCKLVWQLPVRKGLKDLLDSA